MLGCLHRRHFIRIEKLQLPVHVLQASNDQVAPRRRPEELVCGLAFERACTGAGVERGQSLIQRKRREPCRIVCIMPPLSTYICVCVDLSRSSCKHKHHYRCCHSESLTKLSNFVVALVVLERIDRHIRAWTIAMDDRKSVSAWLPRKVDHLFRLVL